MSLGYFRSSLLGSYRSSCSGSCIGSWAGTCKPFCVFIKPFGFMAMCVVVIKAAFATTKKHLHHRAKLVANRDDVVFLQVFLQYIHDIH